MKITVHFNGILHQSLYTLPSDSRFASLTVFLIVYITPWDRLGSDHRPVIPSRPRRRFVLSQEVLVGPLVLETKMATSQPGSRTFGEKPKSFQIEEGGEWYYVGSEVLTRLFLNS